MRTLVIYDTMGGNTEKVAQKINSVIMDYWGNSELVKVIPDKKIEFYNYDIIFCGSPNIAWTPTQAMMKYLKEKLLEHRIRGDIKTCSPKIPGKYAICFSTYCGAHIGEDEVYPVTSWMASLFGHIGYTILPSIHIPGEMRDFGQNKEWMDSRRLEKLNTLGIHGDIRNRPNDEDLKNIEILVRGVLTSLENYRK